LGIHIFIGIDPGQEGGIAVIEEGTKRGTDKPKLYKLSGATDREVYGLLEQYGKYHGTVANVYCVMEQITPRPTSFMDRRTGKWTSTILKSTCLIYGSYCLLRGMLFGAGVPFEERLPQTWLKEFGLSTRKGESKTQWKNRLKGKAQQLFPRSKVTLAVSDALLLAEYARRNYVGTR